MNKEQQDLAWACLPKDKRAEFKELYLNSNVRDRVYDTYDCGYTNTLKDIFGHQNLTSDTEPQEMLMVEKSKVVFLHDIVAETCCKSKDIDDYTSGVLQGKIEALNYLFGDKCLPDKPNTPKSGELKPQMAEIKPKFKVGDKVRVIEEGVYKGIITEIIGIDESDEDCPYQIDSYRAFEEGRWFSDSDLEPYIEDSRNLSQNIANCDKSKDNQLKDNMEGKELNLCELLKGCEGEEFFSISVGKVTFKAIYDYDDTHPVRTIRKDAVGNEYNVNFYSDGRRNNAGLQDLYPSEDLLRKYPLDARAAWDEWASVRKPKRWYPQHGEEFWYIDLSLRPQMTHSHIPYSKWEGELNCFQTEELCQQAAEAVRETLEKFHKDHTEK